MSEDRGLVNNDRKESDINGKYSKEKKTDGQSSLTLSQEQILGVPAAYKVEQEFLDLELIKYIFLKQLQRTERRSVKVHSSAVGEWNRSQAAPGRYVALGTLTPVFCWAFFPSRVPPAPLSHPLFCLACLLLPLSLYFSDPPPPPARLPVLWTLF